ncbi:MAG: hypothetical protein LUG18_12715 [Candidatus Azobacteroides sp.]|nr:hypothetical protein [Candidatus Azobacteroides sp.]
MNIGIVILIHKVNAWLPKQLASMQEQQVKIPVCIVNNSENSTTHIQLKEILSSYPQLDILNIETKNEGYFKGNFSGARALMEKRNISHAFILNPDVTSNNWIGLLKGLYAYFEKDNNCFITGPKITIPGYKIVSSPIIPFLLWREILYNLFFPFSNPILKKYHTKLSKKSGKVFSIEGSAFLIDTQKMMTISNYFQDIFLYGEETVFGKVAQKNNWNIYFDNSLEVLHHHPPGEISPIYDQYMPESYTKIAKKFYRNRLSIRIFSVSIKHRFRLRKIITQLIKK